MSSCKLRLYGKVLQTENIVKAIEEVKKHAGSRTPGPDGINKNSDIPIERIIMEVKLRLRKRIPVRSRTIKIPKGNGATRTLTVINYFDRIAQQAVKRVISPILEPKQSNYSFGFRKGLGPKIAASKVANYVMNFDVHSVEIDIKSCFDSIRLDMALDMLREMGITDGKLLSTIKHLMCVSKDYKGVGLGQGTILGPLLCNCVLHKLDTFMEETFDLKERSAIKYIRFADDTFIACRNSEEQKYVKEIVTRFIEEVLELKVNEEKTKLRTNGFEYLGYRFYKSKNGKRNVWIRMKDEKKYIKELGRFNFRSNKDFYDFLKWFRGVLYYFDICNDINKFLKKVRKRLHTRSTKITSVLKKESNNVCSIKDGREKVEIDVYNLRKNEKIRYSRKPVKAHGRNELKNLTLVETNIHKEIHYGTSTDYKIEKYRKNNLIKSN